MNPEQHSRNASPKSDPLDNEPDLRQWLTTYVKFYDHYSGCIDAWAEGTADNPTIVAIRGERSGADGYRRRQNVDQTPGPLPVRPHRRRADRESAGDTGTARPRSICPNPSMTTA